MKKEMVGNSEVTRFDLKKAKRSQEFQNIYVNSTRFAYTKWDVQMLCAQISITMEAGGSPVEEVALITMSPGHAKAVLIALEANIKLFETEYGEIVLPSAEEVKSEPLASAAKKNPPRR